MKICFISLGCPRNVVDSEVMIGLLKKEGYEITAFQEEADYVIVNTCGFLAASRKESVEVLKKALSFCKKGAKVIATGCMVQIYKEAIEKECPDIHFLLGSGDQESIISALREGKGALVSDKKSFLENNETPRLLSTPPHYAYLKIAEGCRKRCSYCIIPEIKGPLKSKPLENVLQEFRTLLEKGVFEVILIAQDLGDYGRDLGYQRSEGLKVLLKALLEEKQDFRLRLLYLYPDEIEEELVQLMKSDRRIIPYIDMPIQHVNDPILKAMRRKTSKENILKTIEMLKKEIPHITIRTSLIVGFPGESEEAFLELCQFVKEAKLNHVGIFSYSREEKSDSYHLPNQLDEKTKEKRVKKLSLIQKKIVEQHNKALLGKKIEAVVDGYHPETKLLMVARHEGQCPDVDSIILVNNGFNLVTDFGKRYLIEIESFSEYDLVGTIEGRIDS